jgi:hypothetical protein
MEMVSIEQLVPTDHAYRKLKDLLRFPNILRSAKATEADIGAVAHNFRRLLALTPA